MEKKHNYLKPGDVFHARDNFGRSYFYQFYGLNLGDLTGCSYLTLCNLSNGTLTEVEFPWFQERKITLMEPGMKVAYPGGTGSFASHADKSFVLTDTRIIHVDWADLELL